MILMKVIIGLGGKYLGSYEDKSVWIIKIMKWWD